MKFVANITIKSVVNAFSKGNLLLSHLVSEILLVTFAKMTQLLTFVYLIVVTFVLKAWKILTFVLMTWVALHLYL